MLLEKIRLAGFKSFVDPTTVPFPGRLVGVVGPNGCGKSNVIDAVRWVMGESSAKMLRGESMADVIFNGSSNRKPVGTATIELLFDNSDGSAGGQYAQYSQIAVKRQVSRDGQSSFFLNGIRCRRRDITDLFLGTGLGPRSYSIIEQGMISRLIEARPEDLRLFLEEAAGISRYKDRRRDTEGRIRSARENLDRLNDVRDEVTKQLLHLERQAAAAERFKRLRQEERQVRAELMALRWQVLAADLAQADVAIRERQTDLEASLARQRHLEAEIEVIRATHEEAEERFNEVQGRYYAVGAEIAQLEQAIGFARENRQRRERELAEAERAWREAQDQQSKDQASLRALQLAQESEGPLLTAAEAEAARSAEGLLVAEEQMQLWQSRWDELNQLANRPTQTAQVERTRINHQEQQLLSHQRRLQAMADELGRLDPRKLETETRDLDAAEAEIQKRLEALEASARGVADRLASLTRAQAAERQALDLARAELQAARGRQVSLEALQEAALARDDQALTEWLRAQGLADAKPLAEHLQVTPRWRKAVEVVLGRHLQAVCVGSLDAHGTPARETAPASLALFQPGLAEAPTTSTNALVSHIQAPWSLANLVGEVHTADDLTQALRDRGKLTTGQALVTPAGEQVGPDWLRFPGRDDQTLGVLARAEVLRELGGHIETLQIQSEDLSQRLAERDSERAAAAAERERGQAEMIALHRELSRVRSQLTGARTRLEHLLERRRVIAAEHGELEEALGETREAIEQARMGLHEALAEIESFDAQRQVLVAEREQRRAELGALRTAAETHRRRAQELKLAVQTRAARMESTALGLGRLQEQLRHLQSQHTALQNAIEESAAPTNDLRSRLEQQLTRRLEVERELTEVREQLENLETRLRHLDQDRQGALQAVEAERRRLEQHRLGRQELWVRSNTLEEQLREAGGDPRQLLADLSEGADERDWQERLDKLAQRIERLGPINLAAIDEYQEQAERKRYLDEQHLDVTRSLDTLEEAIRRIDRETRSRFKDTFERVNAGLQQIFPRLFGGGHAYLELTGEDLLDTGVSVMARPPGKRNSSIHQLSGGEKALTAVALVFAIFELNPAPFCMLDEVDAPLDDANVGRFCELLRSMSAQVQFIFITHNKLTMEIASHLVGVTMQEPGVSRLVSVDVEEAARLAAM